MKLGKLSPVQDDRTLMFAKYVDLAQLPTPPKTVDWGAKINTLGMLANDTVGDCTCAALGHLIQEWTANAGVEANVTDAQVLTAYSAISGYRPGHPDTDQGAACLDALNYLRKTGIGGHKALAYVKVNPKNIPMVRAALWLFGGLYGGFALPVTAQKQKTWAVEKHTTYDGAPGSWGGHAVNCDRMTPTRFNVITWGAFKDATVGFWETYVDELYCVLSTDWVNGTKPCPNGFGLAQLEKDLTAVTG